MGRHPQKRLTEEAAAEKERLKGDIEAGEGDSDDSGADEDGTWNLAGYLDDEDADGEGGDNDEKDKDKDKDESKSEDGAGDGGAWNLASYVDDDEAV